MNTGISKGLIFSATLFMAACSEGEALAFLPEGLSLPAPRAAEPLRQTVLAQGDVTLVAPDGFCVQPRSLKPQFALMARCDLLGVTKAVPDAPIGIITVSLAEDTGETTVDLEDIATAADSTIISTETIAGRAVAKVDGDAPSDALAPLHWRTLGQINGHTVMMSFFAPEDSAALGPRGAQMLAQSLNATASATGDQAAAETPQTPDA